MSTMTQEKESLIAVKSKTKITILLELNAGYYVTPNAKVYVEGAWNRVTNKKGNTSLYDHNDNTSDYSKNGAGIENYNFITTAVLSTHFKNANLKFPRGENRPWGITSHFNVTINPKINPEGY